MVHKTEQRNLRTLNLPVEKDTFWIEIREDLFEQLHLVQNQKNRNKRLNLNCQQVLIANHLREFQNTESDF